MASGRRLLFRNIFSVGIIQIANYFFPLITIPIVSRIIGPDKFGTINFSASFIAYFTLLIGFGFDITATRKVAVDPGNEQNRNRVFSSVFISQIILLTISVVLFSICLLNIPQLKAEKQVAIFTFITCLATVLTQNWLFQAMQDLHKIAILSLIGKVLFTAVILLTIHSREDYYWQPLALSVSQVVVALCSFIWSVKKYKLKLLKTSVRDCLSLLWQEKVFFLSLCVISIYTNTNIVVLGVLHNSENVGFYTAGQKLILIMQMVITVPLTQAIYPYIGKAFGDDYNKGIDMVQRMLPAVFGFTFLAGLVIFFGAPLFISFFYGSAFQPAVTVCRILAFVPMIIALGTVMGIHVMLNLKMDKVFLKVTCIGAITGVVLNLLLVNLLGYIGAAITWTVTEFLNLCMLTFLLRKHGIQIFNREYFKLKQCIAYFLKPRSKQIG
ncbi:flippase [Taibaiella koreensis]|uniref:flippase n=1 Tax=Taibaiella koreensis TaxID=1268548 RepID=UPI000E59B961|nr:flippase [Taibaiella koreensis]